MRWGAKTHTHTHTLTEQTSIEWYRALTLLAIFNYINFQAQRTVDKKTTTAQHIMPQNRFVFASETQKKMYAERGFDCVSINRQAKLRIRSNWIHKQWTNFPDTFCYVHEWWCSCCAGRHGVRYADHLDLRTERMRRTWRETQLSCMFVDSLSHSIVSSKL